jgi:hypothetical protein
MTPPEQTEKRESTQSPTKKSGTKIVIFGGLAAIALWLIVLVNGHPIRPFDSFAISYIYGLGITAPAIVVSIMAISRNRQKKEIS